MKKQACKEASGPLPPEKKRVGGSLTLGKESANGRVVQQDPLGTMKEQKYNK